MKKLILLSLLLLMGCGEAFAKRILDNCKILHEGGLMGMTIFRCTDEIAVCTYIENNADISISCFPTPKSKN